MKAFVIDVKECSGCYQCQISCKDEHCSNDWTPYAKPQPEWGHFWGKMNETERGQIPHVKVSHVFVPCQHCKNAPCVKDCPVDAIYIRPDGLVIIDPKKCTGCRLCIDVCPYGAIFFNDHLNIAQKCTGCAHLVDKNAPFAPRCADACPHQAIRFGDESELDLEGTETLHPEYGLSTRVYYKNLPKRFVAGTVYDPVDKEIITGALCTLTGDGGPFIATTDAFGDFWLEGVPAADFTLTIESSGRSVTMKVSTKEEDRGLGDIAIS